MRKLYIFGLIGLVGIIIGLAWADQMTFTTYYPAPYGVYNDMRVMNSLGVGTKEPGTAKLAVIEGDVGIGTTQPCSPAPNNESGNLDVNDIYLRSKDQWVSNLIIPIFGNSAAMNLPATGTYTVLCWATYYSCWDYETFLQLDGQDVKNYIGADADSPGCEQNTIMVRVGNLSGGDHTWNLKRYEADPWPLTYRATPQADYTWIAIPE